MKPAFSQNMHSGNHSQEALPHRLRIAAIDPERNFGGGESQVLGLTRGLLRAGHDAEIFCDPEGMLAKAAQSCGIVCRPLRIRNSVDVAAGMRLRAMLQQKPYDVVHFHTARAHALAPYACGRARALIVTRRMDFVPNRLFAPWLYNRAVDGVAAISEGVAAALARAGIARERITLVSSGVDCEQFAPATANQRAAAREAYGLAANEIAIGSIGALVERKGHRILIDAIGRMAAFGAAHLRCFIAGSGPLRPALEAQISDHEISGKVQLLGPVDDARALLNALDIFVMPSLAEGLGVAALEAMSSGLPVVGSSVGGLQEAILDGETGVLLRPGDADALADAISTLMLNPSLRASMGLAGRRRAVERFSMDGMVSKTLALYVSVLEKSASNRGKRRCEA